MYEPVLHHAARSQQREVTLLFADLRGFTELSASLEHDPLVCELLAHVMDCLTEAVFAHEGYIVDYYGDGLVAMWNAPSSQAAHAALACRAALEMVQALPNVATNWDGVIQAELRLGVGVHTGTTQVGNAGSARKTKYGPRGPNVHLASRVEAATKELGVPLVATQHTVQQLSDGFVPNRICRARMPGLKQPVDLYAVRTHKGDASHTAAWQLYDEALRRFEQGSFASARDMLAMVDAAITEVPSRFLIERTEQELGRNLRRRTTDKPSATGGVIVLSAK
jgi:adenylate cyclase